MTQKYTYPFGVFAADAIVTSQVTMVAMARLDNSGPINLCFAVKAIRTAAVGEAQHTYELHYSPEATDYGNTCRHSNELQHGQ